MILVSVPKIKKNLIQAKSAIENKSCLIDYWCNINNLKINSDKSLIL